MIIFDRINKKYLLNIGLAFVLFYAGIDQLLHPMDWVGFIPKWALLGQPAEKALLMHSILALLLGLAFLLNIKRRWVSAVGALFFFSITFANGVDRSVFLITFRDVSLITASLYLAISDD